MYLGTMTVKRTPEEQAAMLANHDARRAAEAKEHAEHYAQRVELLKEVGQTGATLFGWVGWTVDASHREHASLRFATSDGIPVFVSLWMGKLSKIEVYMDSLKSPDGSITIAHRRTAMRRNEINVSPDRSALAICKDIQRRFVNSDEFAADAIEMRKLLDASISGRSRLLAAIAKAALLGYTPRNLDDSEANSANLSASGKKEITVYANGTFRFLYNTAFRLDTLGVVLQTVA